jgi:hypothetical protein
MNDKIVFFMTVRVRHCVQCPVCLTYYLVGFSPFSNGSYLLASLPYAPDECTLYCSCRTPAVRSRWRGSDGVACEISKNAHQRGYGTAGEISPIRVNREPWVIDAHRYLSPKFMGKEKP